MVAEGRQLARVRNATVTEFSYRRSLNLLAFLMTPDFTAWIAFSKMLKHFRRKCQTQKLGDSGEFCHSLAGYVTFRCTEEQLEI